MLLVTGGLGYFGRRLVAHILASTDARIRLLVRPGTQDTALAQEHPDANRIDLFPASFNRVEDLREALKDIDVVYHLAASLRGSYAAQVTNTVVGTENLFLAVLEAEVTRIVLVSSFSVMGVSQTSVVDESVPLEPHPQWRDPYAFAKLRQEEVAWRYIREHQLPIVIVRPGVIYGPGAPILTSRIGLRLFGLFLHLGGRNEIPLTHVENCADAVLRAGQVADIDGEVFNICDDELPTAKEILKQYRRVVEKIPYLTIPYFLLRLIGKLNELYTLKTQGHLPPVFRPYLVNSVWKSRKYSNCKAKQVLGWTPHIRVEDGLRSTLEHIRASCHTQPTPTNGVEPRRGHPPQVETLPVAVGGGSGYLSMDILYHHRTQGTGAEGVHIAYIIKGFRELGFGVHVVSPNDADPTKTAGSNPYTKKGGIKSKLLTTLSRSLPQFFFEVLEIIYNPLAYLKLKRMIYHQNIRFIYERNAFFLFAGAYLAKKYKIPYIIEVNEVAGEERVRKQFLVNLAKSIERYIFNRADAIIVVSDFLKEKILEGGISATKIYVMPNGVDMALFNPARVNNHLRNQWGIGKHMVVLGFVGWFVAWHNLELLIEAFSQIAKNKNMTLMLIGDGVLKGRLQQMAKDCDVTNKVIFPGAVSYEQVPEYIAMMDICVIPGSNEYRSPIKLFEYMAMGKPVVAPRLKPIQDVIQDGQEGILFSPDDKESLKQSLEFVIDRQEKRTMMGQNARKKITGKHTWRKNAEQIVAIALKI